MNSVHSKIRKGSSVQEKNCSSVPHIPSPVIGDILSNIPLKTVVQSKIVCKEWENIISDPKFAKSHFSKSPRGLFLHSKISGNVLHFVDLTDSSSRFKLCGDVHIPQKSIVGRFLSTKIEFGKCVILSCNGFLCFCETGPNPCYYICNPITRDYTITPPLSDISSDTPKEDWRSEFGFSPKTGQYKVLRLSLSYKQTAMIFTLGQSSWLSIDIPYDFYPYGTTAFLDGTFHWLSYHDMIVAFDVGAETFQEFSFPLNVDLDDVTSTYYDYSLGILDECLSFCHANHDEGHIEIWILKEYGVKDSWVREFVIDDVGKFASGLRVRWVMEDGEKGKNVLLVCKKGTVVIYDPVGGVCSHLKFDGLLGRLTLIPHIPSLTPLKDVIIFDNSSKDENEEDENEEMSPELSIFTKTRRLTDILGQHPLKSSLLDSFTGETSTNPSSSMQSPLDLSTALVEEKLWSKIDECETEDHVFGKLFLDWAQEVRGTRNPGEPPSSADLSDDIVAGVDDVAADD